MTRKRYVVITTVLLFMLVGIVIYFTTVLSTSKIYNGIYIDEVNVGRMSKEQAISTLIEALSERYNNDRIVLSYGDKKWPLPLSNISFSVDIEKSVEKAYNIYRDGNVFKRLRNIYTLGKEPETIISEALYDALKLEKILESIAKQINQNPVNAKAICKNGQVNVISHQVGRNLDIQVNKRLIEKRLCQKDFSEIPLEISEVSPEIQNEMVNEIKVLLASYSTAFNTGNVSRTSNIKVACKTLDGKIIMPGEIFSMDQALGPRTKENGYQEAKIILNNELVEGIGGGICQVTSTMYNSVLLSGLEIIERKNHSLPLSYVGLGRDATIAEGHIDFKFQNNLEYAILLTAYVEGNRVVISFMGKKPEDNRTYKIRTMVLEEIMPEGIEIEIDPGLTQNETRIDRYATPGYKVAVFRDIYDENNRRIHAQKISEDYYKPQKQKISISTSYTKMKPAVLIED